MGKDHDEEQEDEPVLDRFDLLDDAREVEACEKSHESDTRSMIST